ncbi:MAG TPA: hypothetical protein VEX65_08415, partial [Flavisolibacter sp.]|nr:hypothetical protein [Flavisolibacter sp.]
MLYLSISFFAGYLFFYWLFHIRLNWLLLNEDLVQLWLPMGFSFLLVLVIIRPRIHLLKLDKDNGKLRGLYYLIGAAVLFLPVMTGVQFLEKAV